MGTVTPTADLLRASYQQEAARLLFPTDPLLSRAFSYKAGSAESCLGEVGDEALVCRTCGLLLMAGMHGTKVRVRSLRRGSTRRRRDSRNQRRYLSMSSLLTSKNNSNKQIQVNSSNVISKLDDVMKQKKYRYNYQRLINITDGEGKNAVIYTCGLCASKAYFKGVLVRRGECIKPTTRSTLEGRQGTIKKNRAISRSSSISPHSFTKKDAIKSHPHLAPRVVQRTNSQESFQGICKDEEFVAVPISRPAANEKACATAQNPAEKMAKLTIPEVEQSLKKKKKKKTLGKPQSSTSALMNFLSSLND